MELSPRRAGVVLDPTSSPPVHYREDHLAVGQNGRMRLPKSPSNSLKEFREFALRANAVDLAIAVALGAAFTAVVNSVVKNLFTPIIGAILKVDFSSLKFTINGSDFVYGEVINALISFLVVAFALFYFVVKPMNALRRRFGLGGDASPAVAPCPACRTAIVIEARRCPACTEVLSEQWSGDADAS